MTKALAKTDDDGRQDCLTNEDSPTDLKAEIKDGKLEISGGRTEQEEMIRLLGSESGCRHYTALMLGQLLSVLPRTGDNEEDFTHGIRCAAALLRGFDPKDEMEAMIAVQAVCAHMASVELSRRTIKATMLPQMQAYGNLANKFSRTFIAQAEGLAKLRRGGEQVVKHVHVNEGGQAVIAQTVNTGGSR